jgi:outer membrane protein
VGVTISASSMQGSVERMPGVSPNHSVSHRLWIAGLMLAAGLALPACSTIRSPFVGEDGDYAKQKALERLRNIPLANLDTMRAPVRVDLNDPEVVVASVRAQREKFEAMESLSLSIEECRQSALEQNLDLKVALIDPAIAREVVTEEDNKWNAVFDAQARYTDGRQSTGSRVSTQANRTFSLEPTLRLPSRLGGTVEISPSVSVTEQDSEFAELNNFFNTGFQVSISQPLLKGAGRRVNTAALRIAGYDLQASQARTTLEAIRQLSEVDRAYWRLYAARATLDVRVNQFQLSQAQLEKAQRRVTEGLSPQVEVDRARAGVAQRLEGLMTAQNDVLDRQRTLKRIMNRPGLTMDTRTMLVPASLPDPVEYVIDNEVMQTAAIANRMELLDLELQLSADAARILLARDGTLPDVRFLTTYGIGGIDPTLSDAVDASLDRQSRNFNASLSFSRPLDNEESRARLRRALLARIQRIATKDAREQSIREEVLAATDRLTTGWQRILAARQAALAAGTALASEQRQFDLGKSTSTDVLNSASQLAEAQQAEVQALSDYQLSQVDLAQATGTVLGAARVSLDADVAPPDLKGLPASTDPVE